VYILKETLSDMSVVEVGVRSDGTKALITFQLRQWLKTETELPELKISIKQLIQNCLSFITANQPSLNYLYIPKSTYT